MAAPPRMYILTGLSFAGKSSPARVIGASLGIPIVDPDGIAHERGLGLGGEFLSDAQWTLIHAEAERRAARTLKAGGGLVYDTTAFDRRQRQGLRGLAAAGGAEPVLIWVSIGRREAMRRWARNNETRERFAVHADDFHMVADAYTPPGGDEPHLMFAAGQDPARWVSRHLRGHSDR